MTAPIPSGERPAVRTAATAALGTAVLAGLAVVAAVLVAPTAGAPLAWCGAAATLLLAAAVAFAVHGTGSARLARRQLDAATLEASRAIQERARLAEEFSRERGRLTNDSIEERVRQRDEFERERGRLAESFAGEQARLTDEFDRERTALTDEFARERTALTDEFDRERATLTDEFTQERTALTEEFTEERTALTDDIARLTAERTRLTHRLRQATNTRDAAISITANVAGRMQALATGMLADLRTMEDKHADEDVLADLLHLDHRTAQAGRLADSVAVLAGARSGRRWARPIVMESILRGAMGRISGYQRVRVHSSSDVAVAGHAAEGVMHALAELLDNAANFSPPTAEVHVYVEEVPSGVIVSVEDSGLVMGDVQLRRAERAVSGDIGELDGLTGTRLGLPVVGRLARKHGLKVSFRPSARGGTGVLVLIPQDILSQPELTAPSVPAPDQVADAAPARTADEHRPSYAATRAPLDLDPDPVPTHESPTDKSPRPDTADAGGLPRRRRGHTLAAAERTHSADRAEREPRAADDTAKARAARFGSFRQAVRNALPDQDAVQGTTEPEAAREAAPKPEPDGPRRDAQTPDTTSGPL
ncbi:ATP-binding protein [Streptomyces sp. NPDC086549]|uniref:sensor histidine kinase n=1 Tax=Streptomyces sp. NPDC086549 TaxID=3365752 RepID=UPI00382C4131